MTEINLLPWRELKREQEKKQFTTTMVLMVIVAIGIVLLINYYANRLIDHQTDRNQRLRTEIQAFDRQIGEIKKIKELREAFISRMTVVQNLQTTRPLTVHLFDELIRVLPDGVYINKITRSGDNVTLLGIADSNSNVSQLMRNIENNQWIQLPILTEIKKAKSKNKDDKTLKSKEMDNEFQLSFILKPKTAMEPKNEKHKLQ